MQFLILKFYNLLDKTGLTKKLFFERHIFWPLYCHYKSWLEDDLEPLLNKIAPTLEKGHFVDIGAGVGYSALVMSKKINSGMKIVSFEPEERNFKLLQWVVRKYLVPDSYQSAFLALGQKSESVFFLKNSKHRADSKIVPTANLSSEESVSKVVQTTLDDYLTKHKLIESIAFIKVDVQGYELEVLKGSLRTLELNPRVHLFIEFSVEDLKLFGASSVDFFEFFKKLGFNLYYLSKSQLKEIVDVESLLEIKGSRHYINILALRPEKRSSH